MIRIMNYADNELLQMQIELKINYLYIRIYILKYYFIMSSVILLIKKLNLMINLYKKDKLNIN